MIISIHDQFRELFEDDIEKQDDANNEPIRKGVQDQEVDIGISPGVRNTTLLKSAHAPTTYKPKVDLQFLGVF